jgi:Ca2+-binding EF-hand superfamily protein
LDKNGEGSIPTKDIGDLMKELGHNPTKKELIDVMK